MRNKKACQCVYQVVFIFIFTGEKALAVSVKVFLLFTDKGTDAFTGTFSHLPVRA